jgi:hypothetical protein
MGSVRVLDGEWSEREQGRSWMGEWVSGELDRNWGSWDGTRKGESAEGATVGSEE